MSESNSNNQSKTVKAAGFVKGFYGKHPIISNLILIFITGMVLIYGAFIFFDIFTRHGSTTTVPSVRNRTLAEAAVLVDGSDLYIEIADSLYDDSLPPGTIKEVWPSEGSVVKPGTTIFVTVTSFQPKVVTIKDPVEGVSSRQAISYLSKNNIKDVRIVHVPDQFADLVVRALYNGQEIRPGMKIPVNATVTIEVGTGWAHEYDEDADSDYEEINTQVQEVLEAPAPIHEAPVYEPEDTPDIFN